MDLQDVSDKHIRLSRAKWFVLNGSKFLLSYQDLKNFEGQMSVQDIITLLMDNTHDWSNVKINNNPFEFSTSNLKIAFRDENFLQLMASVIFNPSHFS